MDLKRREFLGGVVAGAGVLVGGEFPLALAEEKKNKPKKPVSTDPVALIPLTETVSCSRIGFGTGMRGWEQESELTRLGKEKATELIRFAYDKGVRLFDMADLYGTHGLIAEALADKPRSSYVLVSKIWGHPGGIPGEERLPADVVVKRILKECNTDYIDVMQMHCMVNGEWTETYADQMVLLEKLKKEGVIRAHGVSCHANAALDLVARTPWTDVVHVRINSEGANMEGPVEEGLGLAKKIHAAGIGTIGMKVLGEGKFANDAALRKKSTHFVTNLDCIDVMIPAFAAKEHVTEFIDNVAEALAKPKAAAA